MNVRELPIATIHPTQKDMDRVDAFWADTSFGRCHFYGNGSPMASGAKSMAKLIKDPVKLVRRAKAVVARWGARTHTGYSAGQPVNEDVWAPFRTRLQELGFTHNQISQIGSGR